MARKQRKPVNTDKQVAALKTEAKKYAVKVKDMTGLYCRVAPSGFKSYAAVALNPHGKQIWATLGGADVLTISDAREMAREVIPRIKVGADPFPPPPIKPHSFKDVSANYLRRHVQAKGLISESTIRDNLDRYIYSTFADRDFESIKKSDVTVLLDYVEDNHGGRTADYVLSIVRQIMRWHAARVDDYQCVVTAQQRRTNPKERRRKRILNDDEIRFLWAAADGVYGNMAKFALLTGQRQGTIANAKWAEISLDGIWSIPTEERQKGTGEVLPLPKLALEVIKSQKRIPAPYVFTGRTAEGHFNGYGRAKKRLEAKMAELNGGPLPHWQFHDLRRTARSLLARSGVSQEIAERVLGHTQDAIIETYDQHDYEKERGEALRKLEGLIQLILNPPEENVVSMEAAR